MKEVIQVLKGLSQHVGFLSQKVDEMTDIQGDIANVADHMDLGSE